MEKKFCNVQLNRFSVRFTFPFQMKITIAFINGREKKKLKVGPKSRCCYYWVPSPDVAAKFEYIYQIDYHPTIIHEENEVNGLFL